jgi:hypothetical protein
MEIKIEGNSHIRETASHLLQEGRTLANELYEEGKHKLFDAGENLKEYSDRVVQKVQERPVASVLFLSGLSLMILAVFLRR